MVWMECAIWELANLLKLKKFKFSVRDASSRFRISKTLDEEKARVINSIPKSVVHKSKWALPADFSRIARPKTKQDLHH